MKKILFFILLLMLSVNILKAQNLIAVQHGSNTSFYTNLDTAIVYAQSGDTVYLSGGIFAVNNGTLIINKELHIIGVGHNPDSVSIMTRIDASIYLVSGANNSSLEGFYLYNGSIYAGNNPSNEDVDNIRISRCYLQYIYLSRLSNNWLVTENIINYSLQGFNPNTTSNQPYAQSNYFSNNILGNDIESFGPNNHFKNNTLLCFHCYDISNISNCVFENNIFMSNRGLNGGTSCVFNNNLSTGNFINNNSLYYNNFSLQSPDSIFVNFSNLGSIGNNCFKYSDNYHLKNTSPGKNAGTDGTDIGIYGGMFPWKDGSRPPNPHIQQKIIQQSTDANGSLNVKIKVAAQER